MLLYYPYLLNIENMKEVLKLTIQEVKKIFQNRLLRLTLVVVLLLPLLYGCLYLWAFWDPYSQLKDLPIAVVNNDVGYEKDKVQYNFGNDFIKKLSNNNNFKWSFTTSTEAYSGLKSKKYYAEIVVPTDFSSKILSINSDKPQKAEIKIIPRESNNLIASQIFNAGAVQISQKISQEVLSNILGEMFDEFKTSMSQAADGANKIYVALDSAYKGSEALHNGIRDAYKGSKKLSNGSSEIKDGVNKIDSAPGPLKFFANIFLPGIDSGSSKLNDGAGQLAQGANTLYKGLGSLYYGSSNLSNGICQIKDGTYELSSKLRSGSEQLNSKLNANTIDFLSNPVELKVEKLDPVPNYGTGFAPYFISLGLWVGSLMSFFLIKTRDPKENIKEYKVTLSKYLSLAIIGVIQSTILISTLIFGLGLRPKHILLTYLFTFVVSNCFFAIIHFLVLLAGNVGKLISLIILMLELTSSAGTFPIELTPKFFQVIGHMLPMTYAVNGLRETLSGGNYNLIIIQFIVLFSFSIIFLFLSSVISKRFFYIKDIELA